MCPTGLWPCLHLVEGDPKASEAVWVPAPGSSILIPLLWALQMGVEDALKPDRLRLLTRPHKG